MSSDPRLNAVASLKLQLRLRFHQRSGE